MYINVFLGVYMFCCIEFLGLNIGVLKLVIVDKIDLKL